MKLYWKQSVSIFSLIIVIVIIFINWQLVLLIKFFKIIIDKWRVTQYLLNIMWENIIYPICWYVEPLGSHPFSEMSSESNQFVKEDFHICATWLARLICKSNTEFQGANKDISITLPSFIYIYLFKEVSSDSIHWLLPWITI